MHLQRKKRHYRTVFLVLLSLISLFVAIIKVFVIMQPPITSLTVPPAPRIGMNYYHESMGYIQLTDAQLTRDLQQIQQVTYKLKVYHNPYNVNSLGYVMHIVRMAKARHMYVVWTENDDTTMLTDANWGEYSRNVVADAAQAANTGANEFLVGNEISLHNNGDSGYNDERLPARIKQLVMDCQKNFPGLKGYEDGWFKSNSWYTAKLEPLNKIYFTLYEPWHTFKTEMDNIVSYFGKRAEIGELSTMTTEGQLHYSDQDWTRELMRRYDYARQKGLTIWLFTFRETTNDSQGLFHFTPLNKANGIWEYLKGHATVTYHTLFADDFNNGTTGNFQGSGYVYKRRLRVAAFSSSALANISTSNYVFRGFVVPVAGSGPEVWRAMRLVVGYKDNNNYYFVNIEPNDNRILFFRRQNGTETELQDAVTQVQLGTEYDFEIRVNSNKGIASIQVYWNTVKIIDVIDTKGTLGLDGKVGMKNNGVVGDLADVIVTDIEVTSKLEK